MWRKTKRGLVLDPPEFKNFTLTIILKPMYFMKYIYKQGTHARSGPRYRVRVRARVNGDVAKMVSALAQHA